MVAYIKVFNNLSELLKSLEEDISEVKKSLGELLRTIEDLRIKAENEKTLNELLTKLGVNNVRRQNVVNLKNLKIIINPSAVDELTSLESLAEYVSRKLAMLQGIKKELEALSKVNIEARIEVVYVDGIPKEVYIKY